MGIRFKQVSKQDAVGNQLPRPATRDYAEELQRRAGKLARHDDTSEAAKTRRESAKQQRQIEQQMARLRSEAVRARRLAEYIDNLSQDASTRKRNRIMPDTPTAEREHAGQANRRANDLPRPGGNQLSFNPLHPSMELPPEQLIRLLGMEGKKKRRHRQSRNSASTAMKEAKPTPPSGVAREEERPPATPVKCTVPDRLPVDGLDEAGSGWLKPALASGIVAGLALSAYLFWFQPQDPGVRATAKAAPAGQRHTPTKKPAPAARPRPATAVAAPAAAPVTPAESKSAPAPVTGTTATTPVHEDRPMPTTGPATPPADTEGSAAWHAAIEEEGRRLRAEAEQRFNQQLIRLEAERELQQPQNEPDDAATTAPAIEETEDPAVEAASPVEPPVTEAVAADRPDASGMVPETAAEEDSAAEPAGPEAAPAAVPAPDAAPGSDGLF